MFRPQGKSPLGPFAFYILRPTWVISPIKLGEPDNLIVWSGMGAEDVPIHARQDGFIIFEFDKSDAYKTQSIEPMELEDGNRVPQKAQLAEKECENIAYNRIKYMNSFLFSLYSGISIVQSRGGKIQAPIELSTYHPALIENKVGHIFDTGFGSIPMPHTRTDILKEETLNYSLELMKAAKIKFGDQYTDILSLSQAASYHYCVHQFSSSLIVTWSIIEILVNTIWKEALLDIAKSKHITLNSERNRFLTGRDFTIAIVIQNLSLMGRIENELFTKLESTRKKRNNFAHSLESINSEDSSKALQTLADILKDLLNMRVANQLSLSFLL